MFLVQSGTVTLDPDFEDARSLCSLSFLRAALSGTVMKTHSRPKAVQFWQGCVFEHRDFRVRHSTQELIGRGFLRRTTRDCNTDPCSGIAHTLHLFAITRRVVEGFGGRGTTESKGWLTIALGACGVSRKWDRVRTKLRISFAVSRSDAGTMMHMYTLTTSLSS